jgi:hypothetical protein
MSSPLHRNCHLVLPDLPQLSVGKPEVSTSAGGDYSGTLRTEDQAQTSVCFQSNQEFSSPHGKEWPRESCWWKHEVRGGGGPSSPAPAVCRPCTRPCYKAAFLHSYPSPLFTRSVAVIHPGELMMAWGPSLCDNKPESNVCSKCLSTIFIPSCLCCLVFRSCM